MLPQRLVHDYSLMGREGRRWDVEGAVSLGPCLGCPLVAVSEKSTVDESKYWYLDKGVPSQ